MKVRCNRCRFALSATTTVITRNFGRERVCSGCAKVLLDDRQCEGIEQPHQPPEVAMRKSWARANELNRDYCWAPGMWRQWLIANRHVWRQMAMYQGKKWENVDPVESFAKETQSS